MKLGSNWAKLARRFTRKFPNNQMFVRNTARKWFVDQELISASREGFLMYASPYNYMSYHIFFYGMYDTLMTQFFRTHIFEGAVCFDIGAERGWFTLLMGSLVGSSGRVESFEPFPENYEKLTRNISLNHFEHVNAHQLALSDTSGQFAFVSPQYGLTAELDFLEGCSGVGYLDFNKNQTTHSLSVSTTTLDEHIQSNNIERVDFIKLDIEGAEVAVLRGGLNTLKTHHPIIVIEYNRSTLERAGSSIEELDALLDLHKYDRFVFDGRLRHYEPSVFNNLPITEQVYNVYCLPRKGET
jgi:FkbM family methyltransferase